MSRPRTMAVVVLALALGGCGEMDTPPTPPETASVAAVPPGTVVTPAPTVDPTPRSTVPPEPMEPPLQPTEPPLQPTEPPLQPTEPPLQPTEPPLQFLPDLNADTYKQALIDGLYPTCRDGDGTDNRMWTCSYRDEVEISVYGPSPAEVSAFRVVTDARHETDRRSWLRGSASLISVEVFEWVYDHFGTNQTAYVGGVWIQMSRDATSDGVLISAQDPRP